MNAFWTILKEKTTTTTWKKSNDYYNLPKLQPTEMYVM